VTTVSCPPTHTRSVTKDPARGRRHPSAASQLQNAKSESRGPTRRHERARTMVGLMLREELEISHEKEIWSGKLILAARLGGDPSAEGDADGASHAFRKGGTNDFRTLKTD
jgi:hypothetical protein